MIGGTLVTFLLHFICSLSNDVECDADQVSLLQISHKTEETAIDLERSAEEREEEEPIQKSVPRGNNMNHTFDNDVPISLNQLSSRPKQGEYKIRNKQSTLFLVAGSWGTNPHDYNVWQHSKEFRNSEDDGKEDGFVWKVLDDGRIQNVRSGYYLLADHWGKNHLKYAIYQAPETYGYAGSTTNRVGFEWDFFSDGRIENRESRMYLLAGSWGQNIDDPNVYQFPETRGWKGANDRTGFEWELVSQHGCGAKSITGEWKLKESYHKMANSQYTLTIGWENTDSFSSSESWQQEAVTSIEAGYTAKAGGDAIGGSAESSVKVTASYARQWGGSSTIATTNSKTQTEQVVIQPLHSGVIWQWEMSASDACGDGTLLTKTYALTDNSFEPPCCPPGTNTDMDNKNSPCWNRTLCLCSDQMCRCEDLLSWDCEKKAEEGQCVGHVDTGLVRTNCPYSCGICANRKWAL